MIRIFIGADANNGDLESQAVLEWSIRKNTDCDIEITWMQLSRDPASPFYSDGPSGWQTRHWTTPFSGFRWCVPELCGWEGEAIYLDSDLILLADVGELWAQPLPAGKVVLAKGGRHGQRLCVSKWHCFRAFEYLPKLSKLQDDPHSHRGLMRWFADHPGLVQQFEGEWNALDLEPFDLGKVKALHYTGIPTQLQLKHALPRLKREGGRHWYTGPVREHPRHDFRRLFDRLLTEAEANGYGIEKYRREPFGEYQIRAGR
jgi:hypothetical protein